MNTAIYAMPGNEAFADRMAIQLGVLRRGIDLHRFPDGETRIRVAPCERDGDAIVVCTLDHADTKLLPLLMAAAALRGVGAVRIGLVAPYLGYMRQDARFHHGEAVSSRVFNHLLADAFDWVVTVDPHLHRFPTLAEAGLPNGTVVHAAAPLAAWIRANAWRPLIIGPDEESAQWAAEVAGLIDAPVIMAKKTRHGDRAVSVSLPDLAPWFGHTPVLVDDIVASGRTTVETVHLLRKAGMPPPVCMAVHGIFSGNALSALRHAGVAAIVTTNTIVSEAATIDLAPAMAAAIEIEPEGGCMPRGEASRAPAA